MLIVYILLKINNKLKYLLGYKLVIEKVWSNNVLLPKASIIKVNLCGDYHCSLATNKFGKFTYRLKLSLVHKSKLK